MSEGGSRNDNFCLTKTDATEINIEDFSNPWNFYSLFLQNDEVVFPWLRQNKLIADELKCEKCGGGCTLSSRPGKRGGMTFRCTRNRNHEYSIFKYSFFDRGHTNVRDVLQFIKSYLDCSSVKMCSSSAGISYRNTAIKWASYIREIFVEFFAIHLESVKFSGEIEIDESLFGRKWKHYRGKNRGAKVWIFGLIERSSNRILLYPVDNKDETSLCDIIKKHFERGSTIFSDGWAGYLNLNEMGFQHFSVIHKTSFKQTYKNDATGQEVVCHTNMIEGAWKHAKEHFQNALEALCDYLTALKAEIIVKKNNTKL